MSPRKISAATRIQNDTDNHACKFWSDKMTLDLHKSDTNCAAHTIQIGTERVDRRNKKVYSRRVSVTLNIELSLKDIQRESNEHYALMQCPVNILRMTLFALSGYENKHKNESIIINWLDDFSNRITMTLTRTEKRSSNIYSVNSLLERLSDIMGRGQTHTAIGSLGVWLWKQVKSVLRRRDEKASIHARVDLAHLCSIHLVDRAEEMAMKVCRAEQRFAALEAEIKSEMSVQLKRMIEVEKSEGWLFYKGKEREKGNEVTSTIDPRVVNAIEKRVWEYLHNTNLSCGNNKLFRPLASMTNKVLKKDVL